MLITLFALLIALGIIFEPSLLPLNIDTSFLAIAMVIAGTAFLIVMPLLYTLILIPLQKLEQKLMPRLVELFRRDKPLRISHFLLFLFPFLSYFLAAFLVLDTPQYKGIILAVWLVAFGGAIDLLRDSLKRITNFLNPFHLVDSFTHEAKSAIQNDQDDLLWASIDDLSEVALGAVDKNKIALSNKALQSFPHIFQIFFDSTKSISRINRDEAVEKETGLDEVSYTLFYFLQRLELIYDKALERKLEMICRQIIVTLGKIIITSAKLDLSMVTFPTHILGRLALKALDQGFNEVGSLATSTLLEISKTIVKEVDLTYAELEEPFFSIIANLNSIAQAIFKKDKTMNIKILTQPFLDLKALFSIEKMAQLRDTPAVIRNLDSVLAEYATLEQVMRTLPQLKPT